LVRGEQPQLVGVGEHGAEFRFDPSSARLPAAAIQHGVKQDAIGRVAGQYRDDEDLAVGHPQATRRSRLYGSSGCASPGNPGL
jgi:hypothetical protein